MRELVHEHPIDVVDVLESGSDGVPATLSARNTAWEISNENDCFDPRCGEGGHGVLPQRNAAELDDLFRPTESAP